MRGSGGLRAAVAVAGACGLLCAPAASGALLAPGGSTTAIEVVDLGDVAPASTTLIQDLVRTASESLPSEDLCSSTACVDAIDEALDRVALPGCSARAAGPELPACVAGVIQTASELAGGSDLCTTDECVGAVENALDPVVAAACRQRAAAAEEVPSCGQQVLEAAQDLVGGEDA